MNGFGSASEGIVRVVCEWERESEGGSSWMQEDSEKAASCEEGGGGFGEKQGGSSRESRVERGGESKSRVWIESQSQTSRVESRRVLVNEEERRKGMKRRERSRTAAVRDKGVQRREAEGEARTSSAFIVTERRDSHPEPRRGKGE